MLGSVANHAWGEDSIYLSRSGMKDVRMDLESKTIPSQTWRIGDLDNVQWTPDVRQWRADEEAQEEAQNGSHSPRAGRPRVTKRKAEDPLLGNLREAGAVGMTTAQLAEVLTINRSTAHKRLTRLLDSELIERQLLAGGTNKWIIKS